jgi:hypothetical protein
VCVCVCVWVIRVSRTSHTLPLFPSPFKYTPLPFIPDPPPPTPPPTQLGLRAPRPPHRGRLLVARQRLARRRRNVRVRPGGGGGPLLVDVAAALEAGAVLRGGRQPHQAAVKYRG